MMTNHKTPKKLLMRKSILTLLLILGPFPGVFASELTELFTAYKGALKTGNSEIVLEKSQAVHAYAEANLPEKSKSRAASVMNYGSALLQAKQYDAAEKYLNRALKSYRKIYGEKAVEVVDPLLELATARARNAQHSASYSSRYKYPLREALSIAEDVHGKNSVFYALIMLEFGKTALDNGYINVARQYLNKAHKFFSSANTKNTYNHFISSFYLGKYYMVKKQYARAESYLTAALEMATGESTADNHLALTARAFLVEVYEELNEPQKSIAQCRAIGAAVPFNKNQDPLPLFRRMPEYPKSALFAKLEGYAIVNYTISDSGIPTNISTVKTQGSKSFGNASEKFVKKLRFAPQFVDGKPVDTPDQKIRVKFHMAD